MSQLRTGPNRLPQPPLVLVADEDTRVVELLQLALTQQHLRVITAHDGDEAIRRALAEHPDLVVLDARLPRKNGLEVCDFLRHDPEDPQVPIVLLSTSCDTESRLDGLARGADDFLAKPFSPKELIARIQRLLTRSGEARVHRRRSIELEHELARAQDETRRAHGDMRREQRLRELAFGLGRELQRTLDLDALGERVLVAVQHQLGCSSVALLAPAHEGADADFVHRISRGDAPDAFTELSLSKVSELRTLLAGLGRPVSCDALVRFPELREELPAFVAAGAALLVPLRHAQGVEGVLLCTDRRDGVPITSADLDALTAFAELAASGFLNARRFRAQQDQTLRLLAERAAPRAITAAAIDESARLIDLAAERLALPAREVSLLQHAMRLSAWGWSEDGRKALASMRPLDPTGRIGSLAALIAEGESLEMEGATVERRRAAVLLGVGVRHAIARIAGRSRQEGWSTALAWAGVALDGPTRDALGDPLNLPRQEPHGRAA
ncbi:MAG: response regulator [Candidatus Eisenbacteria bacterium]